MPTNEERKKIGKGIIATYAQTHRTSKRLYEKALRDFANAVTHDLRYMNPFPIYITKAKGSRKWDVDGNEYVDYWIGHGSLLLGHEHPEVVKAVTEQLKRGTHYGACHELEIRWADLVRKLVPSAERVRFHSSGTEATLMALRLARACTGRNRVLKFEGHFHGWHDYVVAGVNPPYDVPISTGVPKEVLNSVVLCPPNDIERVESILKNDRDIACVILEPSGGTSGRIPTVDGFLPKLREITSRYGVVLIFDEVITGFRFAPGGCQERYGVIPDLTTLAKILAGGLPGAAVAGKEALMRYLDFTADPQWNRYKKIAHQGTFNANPLSASAGIATLSIIAKAKGKENAKADKFASDLRKGMNEVIDKQGITTWCVYGESSLFNILMNHKCKKRGQCDYRICDYDYVQLKTFDLNLIHKLRSAMILKGVDFPGWQGWVSSAHTEKDLKQTIEAFDSSLSMLEKEGDIVK